MGAHGSYATGYSRWSATHPEAPGRPSHAAFRSGQAELRLPAPWLNAVRAINAVDPAAVDFLRIELQLPLFAHDAGKETAHRMLLPAGQARPTVCGLAHADSLGLAACSTIHVGRLGCGLRVIEYADQPSGVVGPSIVLAGLFRPGGAWPVALLRTCAPSGYLQT
jgi:hypothetical protein